MHHVLAQGSRSGAVPTLGPCSGSVDVPRQAPTQHLLLHPPLLLSQSRAVSPHFPEHWHNFHIPKATTICLPALPSSRESPGLAAKGD